jgi:hypothetical protein
LSGRPSAVVSISVVVVSAISSLTRLGAGLGGPSSVWGRTGQGGPSVFRFKPVAYWASQALKRSFSSASMSTQNSKSLTSALPRLAAAVGICGPISVLPSE